jgi:hypothetical protein
VARWFGPKNAADSIRRAVEFCQQYPVGAGEREKLVARDWPTAHGRSGNGGRPQHMGVKVKKRATPPEGRP